jgi:hypothetical protein
VVCVNDPETLHYRGSAQCSKHNNGIAFIQSESFADVCGVRLE